MGFTGTQSAKGMKLRIFTLAWGNQYLDWFERACFTSLTWPRNLAALKSAAVEWNFYTNQGGIDRARSIIERSGIPCQTHPFAPNNSSGETLQPVILDHLRNCVQTGCAFFMAPPDTIFGEGSVETICTVGSQPKTCIAVPHVRVNAEKFMGEFSGQPMENAQLVTAAFKHLHKTWTDAEAPKPLTNSFMGGVMWRRIGNNLYAVSHRLPTCYLGNIDQTDVDWFAKQHETGTFDHTWPVKLVKEQRQRVIGSSDGAFIVELTRENENLPPVHQVDPAEPDKFWRDLEHNYCNRNLVAIFRGSGAC